MASTSSMSGELYDAIFVAHGENDYQTGTELSFRQSASALTIRITTLDDQQVLPRFRRNSLQSSIP
jgi:hypothetical protein